MPHSIIESLFFCVHSIALFMGHIYSHVLLISLFKFSQIYINELPYFFIIKLFFFVVVVLY